MKKLVSIVILFLLLVGGVISYIKASSPLVSTEVASGNNGKIVIIEIGNKHVWGNVYIEKVLVNGGVELNDVMVQVSNPLKGFIVTDWYTDKEAKDYNFQPVESVAIQPNTTGAENLEKVNTGTAKEDDLSYALSIAHEEEVEEVVILYRYLGFTFKSEFVLD